AARSRRALVGARVATLTRGRSPLPGSHTRWVKVALGVAAFGLLPTVAEAHFIGGSGAWTDELFCLIPTGVMLVAVVILSRPTRASERKPDEPRKDET